MGEDCILLFCIQRIIVFCFFGFFLDDRINNMILLCFNSRKKKLSKGVRLEAANTNSSDVYLAWAMTHSFQKEVKIFKSLYLFFQDEKANVSVSCDSSPPLQTVVMSPM